MVKIAGMVTLYNPTQENLKNIEKYVDLIDCVYIIDNSSTDNSKLIPKKNKKKMVYLPNYKNLGIAEALNIAAKKALDEGYDWLLTMDQDSIMTVGVLKKLIMFVEKNDTSNIGIVSPYHDVDTNRKKMDVEVEEKVEVMTSGNLLNLDLYKKIGGFKSWLFIDSVDIEYCLNLRKNGYKVIRLNNVVMKHTLGNTVVHKIWCKRFICSNHNAIRRYYMVRNMLYVTNMYKKYFPGYCRYLRRVQRGQVRYIIMFEKDKINKLKHMYKGYKDYKKGIKGKLVL